MFFFYPLVLVRDIPPHLDGWSHRSFTFWLSSYPFLFCALYLEQTTSHERMRIWVETANVVCVDHELLFSGCVSPHMWIVLPVMA